MTWQIDGLARPLDPEDGPVSDDRRLAPVGGRRERARGVEGGGLGGGGALADSRYMMLRYRGTGGGRLWGGVPDGCHLPTTETSKEV